MGFEPTTFALGGRRAIHCATSANNDSDISKNIYIWFLKDLGNTKNNSDRINTVSK